MRLKDRVVIVVGAGSSGSGWGNGKASAVLFAREGANIFAVDQNEDAAQETVAIIRAEGNDATAYRADVTEASACAGIVEQCLAQYGRIDVLHYNVGILEVGGCVELDEGAWRRVFDVNVTGCFLLCKYVLPVMERQRRGVLLTTGSIAGTRWTGVNYISYSASKAALIQFTRSVAMQYAASNIRAVSILPGLMDTPMIRLDSLAAEYGAESVAQMRVVRDAQSPTGRMGVAWDVAHAALFAASDEAAYITATEIVVDGGLTAAIPHQRAAADAL